MNYLTYQLLNQKETEIIIENLNKCQEDWEDGKKTAGSHASKVKNNIQLNRQSETSKKYSQIIIKRILSNSIIKSFALPKTIHGIMFSKSLKNMKYGTYR